MSNDPFALKFGSSDLKVKQKYSDAVSPNKKNPQSKNHLERWKNMRSPHDNNNGLQNSTPDKNESNTNDSLNDKKTPQSSLLPQRKARVLLKKVQDHSKPKWQQYEWTKGKKKKPEGPSNQEPVLNKNDPFQKAKVEYRKRVEERHQVYLQKQQRLEKLEQDRKDRELKQKIFNKRTKKGQPLMKSHLKALLDKLEEK